MAKIPCSVNMFYKMTELAEKYGISVYEVHATILRDGLEKLGFTCDHKGRKLRSSKKGTSIYCSRCWRFFDKKYRATPKAGEKWEYYTPRKTFLDLMKEEKELKDKEADPMGGLQLDKRGGE